MPIEFRCESCSKLLRTPDESAGKKAKCPQCGAIVDVPTDGASQSGAAASSETSPQIPAMPQRPFDGANPFAALGTTGRAPDSDNPYASPSLTGEVQQAKPAAFGELAHNVISFDDLLRTAWSITMDNLGPMAIFGVVMLGVQIALAIFNQAISFAGQMSGVVAVLVGVQVSSMVINFLAQTWVGIVSIMFCTRMARDRQANLNSLSQAGPHMLRALGLTIVLAGIFILFLLVFCGTPALIAWITTRDETATAISAVVGLLVCLVPIMLLFMNYMLAMFFIVDRKAGVFAAMGLSRKFMRGNKMTAFLTIMVMQILGGLFVLFTCCAGRVIYDPFSVLVLALMYLTATGQPYERPLK